MLPYSQLKSTFKNQYHCGLIRGRVSKHATDNGTSGGQSLFVLISQQTESCDSKCLCNSKIKTQLRVVQDQTWERGTMGIIVRHCLSAAESVPSAQGREERPKEAQSAGLFLSPHHLLEPHGFRSIWHGDGGLPAGVIAFICLRRSTKTSFTEQTSFLTLNI